MTYDSHALDRAARTLMATEGLGYADAVLLAAEQAVTTGHVPVSDDEPLPGEPTSIPPWLDPSPLASPPIPWSEDDWQRDQRRAAAAELDGFTFELWQGFAEQGIDGVAYLIAERDRAAAEDAARYQAVERAGREARELDAARATAAAQAEVDARRQAELDAAVAEQRMPGYRGRPITPFSGR
jgi:hypothetical protein